MKNDWVQVEPGIFRKEVGVKKFEFKYRVKQKDGVGAKVDTIHKVNERGEPFRTLKETKAHCKAYIEEIMSRTERSMSVPNLHTLQEIFDDYVEKRGVLLAPNCLTKHKGDMKHITAHFKKRRIDSITPGEILNFVTGLREKQAYSTTRSVLATMAKVWKYAYEVGIIDRDTYIEIFVDTTTKVRVPKVAKDRQAKKKQPEVYTTAQIETFCSLAKQMGTVYYILILLCYYGGLRLSEAMGMQWQDVNWETGKITVHRQLVYDKNCHTTHIGPTKSKVDREFQAPPTLLSALSEWKVEQEQHRKEQGHNYLANEVLEDRVDGGIVKGGAFVLRDECGELITHSKAGHFREHMQQQSGDHFYYHALRHTVVSRLAGAGVPLKNVSAFIGHSDTRTTEMFYLGLDELGENKLAAAIQNL